jgi:DNA-binding CsgD family transcriptional regulator
VKGDAISVVEAAYDLESDTRGWLAGLLERAAPHLDRGFGLAGAMWRPGQGVELATIATHGMSDRVRDALLAASRTEAAHQQSISGMILGTATRRLGLDLHEMMKTDVYERHLRPVGICDTLSFRVPDPSGLLVLLSAPQPDARQPSNPETTRWGRIGAHVAAGARLRGSRWDRSGDPSKGADAVLSPSGAVHHAEKAAQGRATRDALRTAARAIDRARSKARSDDDGALDLWRGLVAGRWSLVDRFDTDGRRFVVARKNDPQVPDPRALSMRERQVLAYVALGHPLKLVAYTLGLTVSTVALHRKRAMRKLGLKTQADVAHVFARARDA